MTLACNLWKTVKSELTKVLQQRKIDSAFISSRTEELEVINKEKGLAHPNPDRQTIIREKDRNGRVVVGPLKKRLKLC